MEQMNAQAKSPRAEPKAVSVMEAAAMLRVGRSTMQKLVRERKVQSLRIGRVLRITVASIDELIRRSEAE
jgi:excisionase family DNA binding protein